MRLNEVDLANLDYATRIWVWSAFETFTCADGTRIGFAVRASWHRSEREFARMLHADRSFESMAYRSASPIPLRWLHHLLPVMSNVVLRMQGTLNLGVSGRKPCVDRLPEVSGRARQAQRVAEDFSHFFFYRTAVLRRPQAQATLQIFIEIANRDAGQDPSLFEGAEATSSNQATFDLALAVSPSPTNLSLGFSISPTALTPARRGASIRWA